MTKSRYESRKPAHQTTPNGSQPPLGSVAVFEWETFSQLPDFSDQSLTSVFKRISRDIIERPYHYDPHRAFDAQGNSVKYNFTKAGNENPPEKITGIAVYKQNHGTGHAIRQMIYTAALIEKIAKEGNPKGQAIAQKINNNPEIKSILKLAAYCKRIGRAFDHEHDNHLPGQPTIYSKRSSDMFAQMANELGYSQDLVKIIKDSMLEPSPRDSFTLNSYKNVAGIDGKDLKNMAVNVLMSAHMADLTRIFTVKKSNIENSLKYYFEPTKLKEVSKDILEMACKANAMTGNAVAAQEEGIKHEQKKSLDGKKLVAVVNNIGKTIDDLAQLANLKLTISTADVKTLKKPLHRVTSQNKSVFAFDIDDTLIQNHSFRVKGGPIFNKDEMSKIKTKMAEAIKNGHDVWIVTANWSYKKEQMQKLFAPDHDNLLEKIKFYNAVDIAQELNIPSNKLQDVHSLGLKGAFLAKKIAHDPDLKNYNVNCVLFDDTQIQINNCATNSTDKIKIEGYRVDDYQALRGLRAKPHHPLSDEFAFKVSKAGVVKEFGKPIQNVSPVVTPIVSPTKTTSRKQSIIPFKVDFAKQVGNNQIAISEVEQAKTILNEVDRLHKLGAKTVGITYSANQDQTDKILATYANKNQWKTRTAGSNQAMVINNIEKLLETSDYQHLQSVYRTVPITTMKYVNHTAMPADNSSVQKSLTNANQFIANGGVLLGWQNQFTKPGHLAIGGGVAAKVQTNEQKEMINQWVTEKLQSQQVLTHSTGKDQKTPDSPKSTVNIKNTYEHKAFKESQGRYHFFAASPSGNNALNKRYQNLSGDHLKTKILEDLKDKIQNITSKEDLKSFKTSLMKSPEYEVLKTGQGLFTRITGIKTSSVTALEDMIEQKEKSFDKPSFKL